MDTLGDFIKYLALQNSAIYLSYLFISKYKNNLISEHTIILEINLYSSTKEAMIIINNK